MVPTDFPQATGVLAAPPGWDDAENGPCEPLPYAKQGPMLISMWRPDELELARLNAGFPVVLGILADAHPVVAVSVAEPMVVNQRFDVMTGRVCALGKACGWLSPGRCARAATGGCPNTEGGK